MRSAKSLSILSLLLLGAVWAGANLWFAAARSTIPLALHGTIKQKQRLIEKTPGVDDVYLVTLNSGRRLQVDRAVYTAVAEHQVVHKAAWARSLQIDGRQIALSWSADVRGMVWTMPLIMVLFVLTGLLGCRARLPPHPLK